jgi:hypothetical protein
LSLNKVLSILTKNGFTPVSLYCLPEKVGFIEVRTPKIQKTFIISVPEKYKMKIDTETHKTFSIFYQNDDKNNLDHIDEIKGPLLMCDLVAVGDNISHYLHNGNVYNYSFGEKEQESSSEESELDIIDKLETETNKMAKKLKIKIIDDIEEINEDIEEDIGEDEGDEGDEEHEEDEDEEKEDEDEEKEEQDEEGDKEKNVEVKKKKSKDPKIENVPLFNEEPIDIGIIYISISLDVFYKQIKHNKDDIETDIIKSYSILDDNQNGINDKKFLVISDLSKKLVESIQTKIGESKKEILGSKVQIQKLSSVIENLDKLMDKMTKNPQKYEKEISETNSLITQTKTTLHEINVEQMRLQENLSTYLNSAIFSLNDILDM